MHWLNRLLLQSIEQGENVGTDHLVHLREGTAAEVLLVSGQVLAPLQGEVDCLFCFYHKGVVVWRLVRHVLVAFNELVQHHRDGVGCAPLLQLLVQGMRVVTKRLLAGGVEAAVERLDLFYKVQLVEKRVVILKLHAHEPLNVLSALV